ncbi:MAG TPA: type II toxin-antitoxin system RelE/ParE family toxin [Candidatus Elarobacter sp.]|nr:type II toxin-antitoxin system RelE/ParE family toxin [Candidatus Elarobacter sp.]
MRKSSKSKKSQTELRPGARIAPRNLIAKLYRAPDGSQPVDDFIEDLSAEIQVIVDTQIARINLLDEVHNQLAFPHSSQVKGSLRELRCHYGNTLYRILYRQSGHFVILLHMIRKNTDAIPSADIAIAVPALGQFPSEVNMVPARPPRAAGKDAPRKHTRT